MLEELIKLATQVLIFVGGIVTMTIGFAGIVIVLHTCLQGIKETRPWGRK